MKIREYARRIVKDSDAINLRTCPYSNFFSGTCEEAPSTRNEKGKGTIRFYFMPRDIRGGRNMSNEIKAVYVYTPQAKL